MEQLIVQVANKQKAKMLSEILLALDFVDSIVSTTEKEQEFTLTKEHSQAEKDFFATAGLWKNRDINAESLRQEAWGEEC